MCLFMAVFATGLVYLFLNVNFIPGAASRERGLLDPFMQVLFAIAGVFFAAIITVLAYSLLFFRRRRGDDTDARPVMGRRWLEVTWTVIPLIVVSVLSVYGAGLLDEMSVAVHDHGTTQSVYSLGATVPRDIPPSGTAELPELTVNVTASRFAFLFDYPEYGITSYILVVPVDQRILFHFRSLDAIHSFWVPQWGPQQDAVPGMETTLRITPDQTGEYLVQCNQLCGPGHTQMTALVRVLPAADFEAWLAQQQASPAPGEPTHNHVVVDLTAQDIAFDKQTITVPAGAHVVVDFDNRDSGVPHNFAVYRTPAAQDEIFSGEIITGPATISYEFTAPETPGDYFFRCDVHPVQMTGTLVVE
jgi:cytochrome c oxidase subunit II